MDLYLRCLHTMPQGCLGVYLLKTHTLCVSFRALVAGVISVVGDLLAVAVPVPVDGGQHNRRRSSMVW